MIIVVRTENMKGKRENNDNAGGPDNKRNRRDGQDDKNAVRLLIPSTIAGAVIGKGGQHIQRMRTQYKATVSVDDSQGPERTILIATDLDATMQIITEMLKYFEELPDEEYDVRLLIHQSLAGCVIGKGGQKIKEIRDKIGCRILKVFSNVAPQSTDRVVQTVGKQEQVLNAVRDVITLTRETPIKGVVHYYEPRNFNRMFSDEYGGYGNAMPNNQRAPRGNNRGNFGGGNGGGGGNSGGGGGGGRNSGSNDRSRNDRSRSNSRRENPFVNPWANNNNNNSGGFGGNNNGGGGGGGGGFPGNFGGGGGGGFAPNFGGGGNAFGNMGGGGGNNFSNPPGFNQGGFGGGAPNNQGGVGNVGGNGGGSFNNPAANLNPGSVGFGGANMNNLGNGNGGFGSGLNNMGNGSNSGGGGGVGGGVNNSFQDGANNNANNNLPNGHDPKNSTQVTIPKDLAGAIIGKGGGRIRRIRNDSGAYITIDEPLPGSTDRIITISGSPKQIQMAQYLLQQSVHESNGGRRNF